MFGKIIAAIGLSLLFTIPLQAQDNPLAEVEGAADLEKVKRAKFRETYVNTGVDFSRYDSVYLGDALFDYRDVGPARRARSSALSTSSKGVFGISEKDRKKFEEIVGEAFIKELGKGKSFKIVDSIGENTMIMRGAVVDIISRVPPEFVGRSEIYLSTVGEATLIMEFLDGKTGDILARVAERGRIGSGRGQIDQFSMPVNSATITGDVRRWANSAARRLRTELDSATSGQ